MPFVPTNKALHKLILKANAFQTKQDILFRLNPKERKRNFNELDLSEPVAKDLQDLRVLPAITHYPSLENYPDFYQQTNLIHLCERYKPDRLNSVGKK
jgi:hypothetical protein